MPRIKLSVWNREFDLDVVYDVYSDESVTDNQKMAYETFIKNASLLLSDFSTVSEYCLKNNKDEIGTDKIENIFKYVIPQSLYICRSERSCIALMCAYKFDPEHGIAVIFEDGKFKEIGVQDIVL